MKRVLLFGLVIVLLTGCFGGDEGNDNIETNDTVQENGNGEEKNGVDSDLPIGTGSGNHGDPYVINIGEMQTGNITDYVTGTPKLYYHTPGL